MFSALSGLFRWLQQKRKIAVNPAKGVWHPGAPASRDRVLDDDEIRLFWRACETLRPPYGALLRFLLLTGCRRDEGSKIEHGEIDDQGVLTIPKERAKNNQRTRCRCRHWHWRSSTACLVSSSDRSVSTIGCLAIRATGRRRISPGSRSPSMPRWAGWPSWRAAALRRGGSTICVDPAPAACRQLGIRHEVIERALNHVSGSFAGVAGVYQRAELLPERREALQRWSDHIAGLVSDRTKEVPSLDAARKRRKHDDDRDGTRRSSRLLDLGTIPARERSPRRKTTSRCFASSARTLGWAGWDPDPSRVSLPRRIETRL